MMKKATAILLVAIMALTLVACSAKSKIVGTWTDDSDQTLKFKKDGTGTFIESGRKYRFTYEIDGDELTIEYDDGDSEYMDFEIDGDTLFLIADGEVLEFTKE